MAWTQHGVQHFEHGFPDAETAERFRKLKVVDVAEGRDPRLKRRHTGTLNDLAEVWLKIRRGTKATLYAWRKRFGTMDVPDAKRLKALETENGRLKRLVAERDLEIEVMKEIAAKKW